MADIVRFQLRRDSAANWASFNPVLAEGEPGLEKDTRRQKVGDGVTPWNALPYSDVTEELVAQTLSAASETASNTALAVTARSAAETARSGAESAAARAEAIPATTDGIVGELITDPTSQVNGVLNATTAQAIDSASRIVQRSQDGVKAPQPNQIISNFQAGHGFAILGTTAASMTDDTADFVVGTQSLAVVTKTDGIAGSVQFATAAVDATGDSMLLTVKVDDTTNLKELVLFAASDVNYANHYQWTPQDANLESQKWIKSGEWVTITLNFGDAAVIGSPNRAALTHFRLRAGTNTGFSTKVRYNRLATIPQAPKAVVSIASDDIYTSTWTHLRPRTDKYGFPVTVYAIPTRTNLVSLDQLHQLEDVSGWEIAGHNDGTGFNTITLAEAEAAASATKKWLLDNGFKGVEHYAYVGGQYNPAVEKMMRKYYKAARSIVSRTTIESIPPANPYRLRSTSVSNGTTAASVKAAITKAVANGGWYILTLHDSVDGGVNAATGSSQYTTTDLEDILAHIAASGVQVRTVGDVLGDMTPVKDTSAVVAEATSSSSALLHLALGNTPTTLNALPRAEASAGLVPASGRADLIAFTPAMNMTITNLAAMTSGTAWTGHTLARMGLYTVDAAGAATLVAQTASDTTLFTATQTAYRRSLDTAGGFPASYNLVAGQRYAVGVIGVGQTAGSLRSGASSAILAQRPPVMGGTLGTGLTDLPASGTIAATGTYPWAELAA